MRSQKYWLLIGLSIPVLIFSLAFARFSIGARLSPASVSSLSSKSNSAPPSNLTRSNHTSTSSAIASSTPISSLTTPPNPDRLCVANNLKAGAEVRSLVDSGDIAGVVIGKVRPGAQITPTGGIQAKKGQESQIEVVPISFKRKDLLTDRKSDGENPEELIKAVMWKVVFDQATQICH